MISKITAIIGFCSTEIGIYYRVVRGWETKEMAKACTELNLMALRVRLLGANGED